ncbi:hypothetical protein SELMODRAFT_409114 [Selaginella moellendorffii]|uniref:DJ-1/PfpI domain-containing protein n=1 Tax=Selaginella moellendorffii TaxID=88036 RepID=D8RAE6_SELML|nr:hypothetical protein SELMODRAFT_409114 [Selaginella moellendorffii]
MKPMGSKIQVAIPIFNNITVLDAIGPYEALHRLPGVSVTFVSDKLGLVVADEGRFKIEASASFEDLPNPDILLVPGGTPKLLPLDHKPLLDYIRKAHECTTFTTSVCTGALILGAAGLLKGVKATTHWAAYPQLKEYGAKVTSQRYIKQGKIVTAAGVSSGIDMAIYLASIITNEKIAKAVQLMIEQGASLGTWLRARKPIEIAGSSQFSTVSVGASPVAEEMAVKEAPKEIFLKATGYHFDTVELKFVLSEKKTTVVFKIRSLTRSHAGESPPLVLDGRDVKLLFVKINYEERKLEEVALTSRHLMLKSLPVQPFLRVLDVIRRSFQEKNGSNVAEVFVEVILVPEASEKIVEICVGDV